MNTTYKEIVIAYDEPTNEWVFELRGRERRVASLLRAKEIIDAPPPKDKKAFTRVKGWMVDYGGKQKPVEVTSIAEKSYSTLYVWIVSEGGRRKEVASSIFADSPENAVLFGQMAAHKKEESRHREEREKLAGQLAKADFSKFE